MDKNSKPKLFYGYIVVVAAFIIMVVAWGTLYSFGVFLKPLSTDFGWTRAMTSGAYSLCIILMGLLGILAGRLNDRFGPRLVMTACGLFLGAGYLLMSQISAVWQLYLFFGVIVGAGLSAGVIPLLSAVARWFVKRRGMMTGIIYSGAGVGMIIMPPMARWLISIYDWRTAYIILGIIALVFIVLAAQFLRRDPVQMGLLPYGEEEIKRESSIPEATGLSLAEASHTGQFWIVCAILFSMGFWLQAVLVHIAPYATDIGISPTVAATILAVIGGLTIPGKLILGSAGDRIGNRLAFVVCFILISAALFWLVAAKELWMLYLFAAIFGFSEGGGAALYSPIVAELFGLSSHGVILGVAIFGFSIGGTIGPLMAGYIFDVTESYYLAFLICAITCVIGLILTSLLRPISSKEGERLSLG